MKAIVIRRYRDKRTKERFMPGDVIDVTKTRLNELAKAPGGPFVKKADEPEHVTPTVPKPSIEPVLPATPAVPETPSPSEPPAKSELPDAPPQPEPSSPTATPEPPIEPELPAVPPVPDPPNE